MGSCRELLVSRPREHVRRPTRRARWLFLPTKIVASQPQRSHSSIDRRTKEERKETTFVLNTLLLSSLLYQYHKAKPLVIMCTRLEGEDNCCKCLYVRRVLRYTVIGLGKPSLASVFPQKSRASLTNLALSLSFWYYQQPVQRWSSRGSPSFCISGFFTVPHGH